MFENAKWIWSREAVGTDSYSEFLISHEFHRGNCVRLRISADSNYAVYVNGTFVDSGQYADFPHYKVYDELDLSDYIVTDTNHIAIIVWHYGVQSFTYYMGKPGLLFELEQNSKVVVSSGEHVPSRKSRRYISGTNESITMMLGLNYHVDLKESDAWMIGTDMDGFAPSIIQTDMPDQLHKRIPKKLKVLPLVSGELVSQGCFTYPMEEQMRQHAGDRMQNAALSFYRHSEMGEELPEYMKFERKTSEGIYFILDLKEETAGYLEFDIEVPEDCMLEVGWGEHLVDGRCRSAVGKRNEKGATARNFSVTARLQKGRNHYRNPFRRLGGRYIQLFLQTSEVKVYAAGICPTIYPVKEKEYRTGNLLRDEIYETSKRTLLHCMHEHYEDCPWREQSFYTSDSRNQMLCGYYAFEEYELPKASLRLIAQSACYDGMLPICYPTDFKLAIPSFSPVYIVMLAEYYRYAKDKETVEVCFHVAKRIADAFIRQIDETGLMPNHEDESIFWNFYEWQPYMDGHTYHGIGNYDMALNAQFSYTLDYFTELCEVVGEDPYPYQKIKQSLNHHIVEKFYDKEAKLFKIGFGPRLDIKPYSALANAYGYLCGAAEYVETERILKILEKNAADDDSIEVIPTTLAFHYTRYDALIKAYKSYYKESILDELDRIYFKMLKEGATTFWETELGHKDFDFAGSLCHGWSAMPIYYYEELWDKKQERKERNKEL